MMMMIVTAEDFSIFRWVVTDQWAQPIAHWLAVVD